jgi:HTH-type transcriptional regulator/antitoxin HipB
MTIAFNTLRDEWMKDPAFREAYDRVSPEMEVAFAIAEARHRAKLSQQELAARIGSSQSHIANIERGRVFPTTKTLKRIAEATHSRLHVELVPA